ncbi:hypothetical protein [Paractinoplanes maris]|uniref:hypothetical protein n=1 Tax=Paractinoplanes maris TaxID=1734446 RepID=UPI002020B5B6|nr:hypothetical protein [Actinoplanes maris]
MRRKEFTKRVLASAVGTVLTLASVGVVQVGTTGSAGADARALAPCIDLDNLRAWYPTSGSANDKSPTYTTTANCVDINFGWGSTSTSAAPQGRVRVCFVGAGYCQSSWKSYNGNTAPDTIVVASNVSNGTTYQVEFDWASSMPSGVQIGFRIYA